MTSEEIARDLPPNSGNAAWRFVSREGGAHFLLADNPDSYTCTLLVSRVDGQALRQAVADMIEAWSRCCQINNRIYEERDKNVSGVAAHYTGWIVQIPNHSYPYVVALSAIANDNVAWRAILTFNPTRTPF